MEDTFQEACAAYHNRLTSAIKAVEHIASALYPALHGLMGGGMERRLIQLLQTIGSIPTYPEMDETGAAPVAISHRQLVRLYGGSLQTWNHYLTLWAAWGLIEKVKPCTEHPSAQERTLLKRAEDRNQYPETRYTIPPYTEAQLQQAEARAAQWKAAKVSISTMTKATLIQVYGQTIADRAYDDERQLSTRTQRAQEAFRAAILQALTDRPYTTQAAIQEAIEAQGIAPAQVRAVWGRCKTDTFHQLHLLYGRPTRAEVERWNLPGMGYIIRAAESKDGVAISDTPTTPSNTGLF